MKRDIVWRLLFMAAIALPLLGILLARNVTPPIWVLVAYPAVGAALALLVVRTSPNREQIVRLETATVAAAFSLAVATGVNTLAGWMFPNELGIGAGPAQAANTNSFYLFLTIGSLLLWWLVERQLRGIRLHPIKAEDDDVARAKT